MMVQALRDSTEVLSSIRKLRGFLLLNEINTVHELNFNHTHVIYIKMNNENPKTESIILCRDQYMY
jgi:hypothetical protein